mgnify:CR=1 FL=1
MAKYIVEMQMDKQEKFYFIRENESGDIVYLPSKYLMHKKRSRYHRIPYKEVPLHYLII